ncbi:MAG: ABC transporter permease [Dehalococcoidia bacterium]
MATIARSDTSVRSPFAGRTNPLVTLGRVARKQPVGAIAGVLCVLLILVAVFANVITPHGAAKLGTARLHPPSAKYLLGTDNLFRDMFSRIIVGSQISLGVGFASVFAGTLAGAFLGVTSGFIGGWWDLAVNRVLDTVMAFPPLILAMFFLSVFQPSFLTVVLAIGLIIAPTTSRVVRGSVLSLKNLQYVEAARALGAGDTRIMSRHILPNVLSPIIVLASIQIGNAILAEAALSFLSLGIATDAHPSWGKMLQDTRGVWQNAWWTAVMPGAAISLAVLSFNMFGDALRDALDPRLRGS